MVFGKKFSGEEGTSDGGTSDESDFSEAELFTKTNVNQEFY